MRLQRRIGWLVTSTAAHPKAEGRVQLLGEEFRQLRDRKATNKQETTPDPSLLWLFERALDGLGASTDLKSDATLALSISFLLSTLVVCRSAGATLSRSHGVGRLAANVEAKFRRRNQTNGLAAVKVEL